MRCDDVQALLIDAADGRPDERRAAMAHLEECTSCRDAQYAAGLLRAERGQSIPPPRPGALARAIAAATRSAAAEAPAKPRRRAGGFLAGLAVGASSVAIAAAFAWAVLVLEQGEPKAPAASTTPLVTLALHEVRPVSISVDAPAALPDAEIRVVLTGSISLDGLAGQRELRWRTDLEAGANQLTLPLVATAAAGGQLLVEVHHGQRRRTFVVDVRGTEA